MTNTKRLRAKKILDMLTQVILDEDKYDDNSVEVIALSNSLNKVKVNKGHLFPSDGNSIVEYNITQENTSKQEQGLTANDKEKLDAKTTKTYGTLEIQNFARTLDKEDDSLWDKRNGVPLLSNFKKFGIDHKTLMKELRGFRRNNGFRRAK